MQDAHAAPGEWGTAGGVDAYASWAEPAPTAFEVTLIETIPAEPVIAADDEAAEAENAAQVAWAEEPPTTPAWEGERTADDVEALDAAQETDAEAPDAVTAAEGRDAEAENAAQVAWAADSPTAPVWESETTADDVEPRSSAAGTPVGGAADGAREAPQPVSTAEAAWAAAVETPFGAPAESDDWSSGETLTVEEAWPGAYGSEGAGDAESTAAGEVPAAEPGAASTDAASDAQQGEDYAQWEADFAAALDSLDQGSGSLSAAGAAEDGSGEAIELGTPGEG